jgi:hypothetical protein
MNSACAFDYSPLPTDTAGLAKRVAHKIRALQRRTRAEIIAIGTATTEPRAAP